MDTAPRACVYTCLLGEYEQLNLQPAAATSGLDFICFTDMPGLVGTGWRVVQVTPAFPFDPVRSQRLLKMSPHDLLPDYDVSLYIDNSVVLTADPAALIAEWLGADAAMAVPGHSFRESVADEFMEVLRLGLDDGWRVIEQLQHYRMSHPEVLSEPPYWSGMIARRHHAPSVVAAMGRWQAHVLRYSRRDQLSLNLAAQQAGLAVRRISLDNHASAFHRWPVTSGRDRATFPFAPFSTLVPPEMQARERARRRAEQDEAAAVVKAGETPGAAGTAPPDGAGAAERAPSLLDRLRAGWRSGLRDK